MKKTIFFACLLIAVSGQMNAQIFINTTGTTNDTDPTYRIGNTTIGRNTIGIEKLDVEGNIAIPFGSYFGVNNTNIPYRKFLQTGWDATNGDYLSFYTAGGSSQNQFEKMRILQNGNLGIGTINPLVKLHVNNGGLMISGSTPGYGGPQLIFSPDINTSPNGRWAIEYISAGSTNPSMGGLNFWKPSPDTGGAGNYSLFLKDDGKIGMGVTDDNSDGKFCGNALPNGYRLYVNGGILTTKVKVANYCSTSWADYVFADDYQLKPLSEVETYIKKNKHLPNIPSAQAIENEGLDLAEIASKQMEKIEELTLYLIKMEKDFIKMEKDVKQLKADNAEMKAKLSSEKH